MFSTPTTASSTSAPMAIASPPSVMVLIDRPKALKTSTVIEDRDRDGGERNQGRAHIHQEQEEDDGDHERRFHEHAFDAGDRGLDEGRLPELDLVGS